VNPVTAGLAAIVVAVLKPYAAMGARVRQERRQRSFSEDSGHARSPKVHRYIDQLSKENYSAEHIPHPPGHRFRASRR
jgi:hypothetical protein